MGKLPADPKKRKELQLHTFMFEYFPQAWLALAEVSRAGNMQHNQGPILKWAREKSADHLNSAFNHLFDHGLGNKTDTDGTLHLAKAAWRLMAQLQLELERGSFPDPV